MRLSILFLVFLGSSFSISAQNFWIDVHQDQIINLHDEKSDLLPKKYRVLNLELQSLKNWLKTAPMEFTEAAQQNPLLLTLPMPDGSMQNFEVAESPMMEQGLSDKFPEIQTFILQGVEDRTATGRMDFNAEHFHAFVLSAHGSFLIQPSGDYYLSFLKKDFHLPKEITQKCGHDHSPNMDDADQVALRSSTNVGEDLRTYRFATCTTGGFASFHGTTTDQVMAAIVTIMNRINTVYERDVAVRLILVANNDELIFFDDATDPFTQGNTSTMINEVPTVINSIIGSANYDIGHVFDDGGGGLAQLQSVCSNSKARGVTGIGPPIGDLFAIDYASHEIGHQFGGNHTFNNCGGNENISTGFEPGSGSTIMSYSGLCNSNNIQFASDDYLHGITVQEMLTFIDAGGVNCAELIPTSNTPPTLEIIDGGFDIPISTPFELTAISTDAEGDLLTYCWEQFNGGPQVPLGSPSGSAPLFRTLPPSESATRVFPAIGKVINNNLFSATEYTPDYARSLNFNVTVRDNNAGAGGVVFDGLSFDVTDSAGPFLVSYPNEATTWEVGQWLEVNWDVANTDNNIVNCKKVNIKLSVDGGFTYPYTLIENTANDGSEFISVPNAETTKARVRVEAADNIFFDISNQNFSIEPASQPGFAYFVTPNTQEICLPTLSTIDIVTEPLLDFDEAITYEVVSNLPAGIVPVFSSNPASAANGNVLTLDMSNYNLSDTFDVVIRAAAVGIDTAYRTVSIRTIGNDFSDLVLETPSDGTSGVPELQQFNWNGSKNATQYLVQIARSPSFDLSTIHIEEITTDTFLEVPLQLDINTAYYWRVQPSNECGGNDFLPTQSFHTVVFSCEKFENNGAQTIASTGLATVENKIEIPSGGTISDLNVTKIKGFHSNMNHLDVSLISPTGTEVELFSNTCLVTTNFDFGLDDEAANNINCPPTGGALYLPQNPLTAFDGESAQGEWILKTQVNSTSGNGGKIQEFHLTVCSDVSLNPPVLIKNELMPVPPAQGRAITDEFLLVDDPDNPPSEIEYTLVTLPEHGSLFYLGNELVIGETFRQSSLNGGGVVYVHNGDANQFDHFYFTVTDGEGGFIGTPKFEIEIDPDAMVNVHELLQADEIKIFPNPNDGNFNIVFEKPIWEVLRLTLFNVHGQMILEKNLDGGSFNFNIQMPHVAEGIYFLKIETEGEFLVKKMIVN